MTVRIVTISEGSDLVAAARDLGLGADGRADPARAWVRVGGPLSAVELRRSGHEAQTLDGDLLLVSMEGPATGPFIGLISASDALGTRMIAGEVIAALVASTTTMCILHESTNVIGPADTVGTRAAELAPSSPSEQSSPALPPIAPSVPSMPPREVPVPRGSAPSLSQAIPQKLVKPVTTTEEDICPDPGDRVEHFAFGTCEVIKSDGDRLHLRLGKDGRIKEIALEMLKVTELPADGEPGRKFKLERRL